MTADRWRSCRGDGPQNDIPTPVHVLSRPIHAPCIAMQVTALNRIGVIAWLSRMEADVIAAVGKDGVVLISKVDRKPRVAHIMDWVLVMSGGRTHIVQPSLFETLFYERNSSGR